MEIILLERVEKLGNMGDVVSVRAGYARNYLLPQKKALRATKENLTHFESHKDELQAHNLKFRDEATAVAARMKGFSCVLVRQAGESDQLYGSVTARDIANELSAGGYNLERRQVILDSPIKTLGVFDVNIALHPEVVTQIRVNVARSEAEAESQAESRLQDAEGGTSAEFFENEELAESAAEELSEDLMDDDGLGLNDAPEDGAEA